MNGLPDQFNPNAETVYLSGCTALETVPDLPNAKYVDLSGCTALETVPELPNAKYVYLSGCTALETVPDLPNAEYVDLSGCTGITKKWIDERLVPLLTATGKTVKEILDTGCWECHSWDNCPMHAVFGVRSVSDVPMQWRKDAAIFVPLFDEDLIPRPTVA